MVRPLLLFGGFVAAIAFLVAASDRGFEWVLAGMMVLMLLAIASMFITSVSRWPESPLQTEARRRRESRTVMDILHDDMGGGL